MPALSPLLLLVEATGDGCGFEEDEEEAADDIVRGRTQGVIRFL